MLKLLISLFALCCFMAKGYADDTDSWQVNGFITQSLIYSSDNNFIGDSDDSISAEFSEAAINLSRYFTDNIRFTGQVAYRNSNALDSTEFFLDLLQLDINLYDGDNHYLGLQAGRVRTRLGIYTDVYDIPEAWPSAMLNETYYPQILRSTALSFEGFNLYHQTNLLGWTLNTNLGLGVEKKIEKEVIEDTWLLNLASTDDTRDDEFYTFSITANNPGDDLTLGYSYLYFRWQPSIDFGGANLDSQYTRNNHFAFLTKSWGSWKFETEWHYASQKINSTPLNFPQGPGACDIFCASVAGIYNQLSTETNYSHAGYLALYHYLPSGLTLHLSYGYRVENKDDLRGKEAEAISGVPHHFFYIKRTTLGFQYELSPNWSIATDFIYSEGSTTLINRENPNYNERDKYWNAIFIRASYHF